MNGPTKYGILSIATLLMVCLLFAGAACADADHGTYGGKVAGTDGYGTTSTDPILITSEVDLYNLTKHSDDWGEGYYFVLQRDLYLTNLTSIETNLDLKTVNVTSSTASRATMTYFWNERQNEVGIWQPGYNASLLASGMRSYDTWEPIGTKDYPFKGNFNGNHKTIYGLFITYIYPAAEKYRGFFGYLANGRSVNITNLTLDHAVVRASGSYIGGFIGGVGAYDDGDVGTLVLANCSLKNSSVFSGYDEPQIDVGGLIGHIYLVNTSIINCTIENSLIASATYNVGGVIGDTAGITKTALETRESFLSIVNTTVSQCTIDSAGLETIDGFVGDSVGGLLGFASSLPVYLENSRVSCSTITCSDIAVGGLVGRTNLVKPIVRGCEVAGCEKIRGTNEVGGFFGYLGSGSTEYGSEVTVTNCSVKDTHVISTGKLSTSSKCEYVGGLIASDIGEGSTVKNNTLENVVVEGSGSGDGEAAYLFDVRQYPISSGNGIARLSSINLTDGNRIINSSVVIAGTENSKLEGFEHLQSEFTITVDNPEVTSIGQDAFRDSHLTGIYNISAVTAIGQNAFTNSHLKGGFTVPGSVSIASNAFTGTSGLEIIYGNTGELSGLDAQTARVNITGNGTVKSTIPGSCTVDAVFKPVMLGTVAANFFHDLTNGTYLETNEAWAAGHSYFALIAAHTKITLNAAGGSGGTSSVSAENGNATLSHAIIAPNRSGYTFTGWNSTSGGGVEVINTAGTLNSGVAGYTNDSGAWVNDSVTVTLYANWSAITYDTPVTGGTAVFAAGIPVAKVDVGSNAITNVTFRFLGETAQIPVKPSGYSSVACVYDAFDLSITGTQTEDVTVFFNASGSGTVFLAHNRSGSGWEFLPASSAGVAGQYTAVVTNASGFSPFQIVVATVASSSSYSGSSSRHSGGSTILPVTSVPTAEATVVPTQAAVADVPAEPTVSSSATTTQKSPTPCIGLLAGLGAAVALLRLRR